MTAPYFMGQEGFCWWQGVVEDINDPLKIGRCRVRVIGYHTDDKTLLPTQDLPWFNPLMPVTSASVSGIGISPSSLVCGSWVFGFFTDGHNAQNGVIIGSTLGIPENAPVGSIGFNDPNEKYPKTDYLNESDVNRLARNENIEKTIVNSKNLNLETNVSNVFQEKSWSEPESKYNSTYPKNKVIETESGHTIELDDTPNSERIHVYHKSGTFQEIYPDGSNVIKIVGKNYEICLDDKNVKINGSFSQNVQDNCNLKISGNLNIEVDGDANVKISGNSVIETQGNHYHKVNGQALFVSEGNMSFVAPRIDFNPEDAESGSFGDTF